MFQFQLKSGSVDSSAEIQSIRVGGKYAPGEMMRVATDLTDAAKFIQKLTPEQRQKLCEAFQNIISGKTGFKKPKPMSPALMENVKTAVDSLSSIPLSETLERLNISPATKPAEFMQRKK